MQNSPEIIQKAKRYIKREKIWRVALAVCVALGYYSVIQLNNIIAMLLGFVVALLISFIVRIILFNKCILSILTQKLDADTYLAMVYQGNFDAPWAKWQLCGEYYCGHYQNVISICKMKMNDPKIAKRHKYYYLIYLANVYFDIGDDENLRKICEQYEAALAKEKPRKQVNYRKRFPRMTVYDHYLKQNIDAYKDWINTATPFLINQYQRTFCKARLALMQGNAEEAKGYYEALAKEVPQLNYGKLAADKLVAQKDQDVDEHAQKIKISDDLTEVTLYPSKRYKLRKAISIVAMVLSLLLIVGTLRIYSMEKEYYREMEAYLERVCVLVEKDYDNVVMLDAFNLRNGEEFVDSMFICKTDTDIIVGCTYVYVGETELHYDRMGAMSIASLSHGQSPLWYGSFAARTSDNRIESYFYTVEEDIPEYYCHLSVFEINGQKVYYVITDIISDS